jgi:iron(III) transport system ATP-binding protein
VQEGPAAVVLETRQLTKRYPGTTYPAVTDFNLQVREGEIFGLLGPSGCGKTTLLRLLAGFETPDAGSVTAGGSVVADAATGYLQLPESRRIGFVFQDYALFPHLTVLQNVVFGLPRLSRRERLERASETLDLVGMTLFRSRYPHQLSGGQQQRVALARALAPRPRLVLLDEPFSSLDAAMRGGTRTEVRRILQRSGTTAILVTHDQEEALTFSDRIAVMRSGKLEQVGTPEEVYRYPRTAFTASFLGTANLVQGTAAGRQASTPLGHLPLSRSALGQVLLCLRPENMSLDGCKGGPDEAGLEVRVLQREFQGAQSVLQCEPLTRAESLPHRLVVRAPADHSHQPGDICRLSYRGIAVPLESSQS